MAHPPPLRFKSQVCAIRIPNAARYCEALIFLLCRDYKLPRKSHWLSHLSYFPDYVDGSDIFREGDLRDAYRQIYHALKVGDTTLFTLLEQFRLDLARSGFLKAI